jgi:hypothetical protein
MKGYTAYACFLHPQGDDPNVLRCMPAVLVGGAGVGNWAYKLGPAGVQVARTLRSQSGSAAGGRARGSEKARNAGGQHFVKGRADQALQSLTRRPDLSPALGRRLSHELLAHEFMGHLALSLLRVRIADERIEHR